MNPQAIFLQHFEQCSEDRSEFLINGTPYRGVWPKNQSMGLFLKDLIEAAEAEKDDEYDSILSAKEKIGELNEKIDDLESRNGDLMERINELEAEA